MSSLSIPDIESYLKPILKKRDVHDFELKVSGLSETGDGYLGDISFITVSGAAKNGESRNYDLVMKSGKTNKHLRKVVPALRLAFENEMLVYDEIIPSFTKFQREKNIEAPFENVAKCIGTVLADDMEVIFLQNLKSEGFELHDRKKPMNFEHVTAIIKLYAKLHALSYALKAQKPELYKSLSGKLVNMIAEFSKPKKNGGQRRNIFVNVIEAAEKEKEVDLAQKIKTFSESLMRKVQLEESSVDENPYCVILHGDCWNNNFMFKYENGTKSTPCEVRFLDWQLSRVGSPVLDLSYFLFTCISYDDIHRFDEINDIYYEAFSDFLRQLGGDPNEALPFEELQRQWKKYGIFGVTMMPPLMSIVLSEKDEVVDVADSTEKGNNLGDTFTFKVKNFEEYSRRSLSVMRLAFEKGFI